MTAEDLFFASQKAEFSRGFKRCRTKFHLRMGALFSCIDSRLLFFVLFYTFIFLTGMVLKSHDLYQSVEYRNRITFVKIMVHKISKF